MTLVRLLIIFVILAVSSVIAIALFDLELSKADYWDHHGVFLLAFLAFFPRLALLFSSIPFGGLFWWLGYIFCPHYLVAILATINYWPTNFLLVCIAWLIALGGETAEKYFIRRTFRKKRVDNDRIIDMKLD